MGVFFCVCLDPAQTNSLQDSISKITRVKWTGSMAQVVECLSSNPSPTKKKKERKIFFVLEG
jgi:hypothetical protein